MYSAFFRTNSNGQLLAKTEANATMPTLSSSHPKYSKNDRKVINGFEFINYSWFGTKRIELVLVQKKKINDCHSSVIGCKKLSLHKVVLILENCTKRINITLANTLFAIGLSLNVKYKRIAATVGTCKLLSKYAFKIE